MIELVGRELGNALRPFLQKRKPAAGRQEGHHRAIADQIREVKAEIDAQDFAYSQLEVEKRELEERLNEQVRVHHADCVDASCSSLPRADGPASRPLS